MTVAVDAMRSASNPHAFMGVTEQGLAAIVKTRGNQVRLYRLHRVPRIFNSRVADSRSELCALTTTQDVHVILRGGTRGPNFAAEHVKAAASSIEKARPQYHPSIMIDCSRTSSFPSLVFFSCRATSFLHSLPFMFHRRDRSPCGACLAASSSSLRLRRFPAAPQTETRRRTT